MELTETRVYMGFGYEWDHISERYDQAAMNARNTVCAYDLPGYGRVTALVTSRGNVLASIGIECETLQYLIKAGYCA